MIKFTHVLLILANCYYSIHTYSQNENVIIKGVTYVDSIATPDVVVALITRKDTSYVLSGTSGTYRFKTQTVIPGEEVQVQASFLGYLSVTSQIRLNKDLEYSKSLYLDKVQNLDAVVVEGTQAQTAKERNKLVYTVRKSDYIKNTEGGIVLNSVPTLSYDKAIGIKINGDREALLFIDGAESSARDLNTIDAKQIERIEVVNTPSTKYGSDFAGGVVNVILRKTDSLYYRGQVRGSAGFFLPWYSVAPSLNIKTQKIRVNGSYRYFENKQNIEIGIERTGPSPNVFFKQNSLNRTTSTLPQAQLNARYLINDKDFVYLKGEYIVNKEAGAPVGIFSNNQVMDIPFSNVFENSYTQYVLDGVLEKDIGKNRLSARVRRLSYVRKDAFALQFDTGDFTTGNTESDFLEWSGLIDYAINTFRFFGKNNTNNLGLKYIDRRYSYSTTSFFLDQDILATYLDTNISFSEKLSFFASLYTEGVLNRNDNFEQSSVFFLPSSSLTWNITKKQSLEVSYSKRIKRPDAYDLNETQIISNPGVAQIGNQTIGPELNHYINLSYGRSLKNNVYLSLNPYYQKTTGAILQNISTVGTLLVYQQQNIGEVDRWGGSVGYSGQILKKIRVNSNIGYKYNFFRGAIERNEGGTFYGNISLSASAIKDKVYLSLYSFLNTPSFSFISETRNYPYTSFSISTNFFKDKLSVTVDYNNIANINARTQNFLSQSGVNQVKEIVNRTSNLVLELSYNFGDTFSTRDTVKTINNSDVIN